MTQPDEDEDPYVPRPTLSPAFWAALAFGLALVLAGGAVGLFGAQMFPKPAPGPAPHGRLGEARFDSAHGAWQGSRPHRI
jgi:hypothetical protein